MLPPPPHNQHRTPTPPPSTPNTAERHIIEGYTVETRNLTREEYDRYSLKTSGHCKCVCKKWHNLVLDSLLTYIFLDFLHVQWVEIEDKVDHHHLQCLYHHVFSLDLNLAPIHQYTKVRQLHSVNVWAFHGEIQPIPNKPSRPDVLEIEFLVNIRKQTGVNTTFGGYVGRHHCTILL
ncbi:hypothetical protein OSB04_016313, partial [Centaurea solstitialis]